MVEEDDTAPKEEPTLAEDGKHLADAPGEIVIPVRKSRDFLRPATVVGMNTILAPSLRVRSRSSLELEIFALRHQVTSVAPLQSPPGLADQHDQLSSPIAYGVQFRVQPPLVRPIRRNSPFLSRLAAVRWAFRWVASIISRSDLAALRASSAKILLNTPSLLHRTNRL